MHQYAHSDGNFSVCCFSIYQDEKNAFDKGMSPLESFNSPTMKSVRKQMMNGEKPSQCKVCWDNEKFGIDSHRHRMNVRYEQYARLVEKTKEDGHLSSVPVYLDFRFGNLCNFKCRMCGIEASSTWAKEAKEFGYVNIDTPNSIDHWTDNNKMWDDMETIGKHTKVIYFAGGEPFVQKGHYRLLEFLADRGYSKNIHLQYNTNLSYDGNFLSYEIEDLWKKFDKVELWPSIEGFGAKAEYGRTGLNWELFQENAKRFNEYITTLSITSNIFSITSQIELIKWIKAQNKNFFITNLINPFYLSTTVLSSEVKKQITKQYKEALNDKDFLKLLDRHNVLNIVDTLKHTNSKDDSHLAPRFKEYMNNGDKFNRTSSIDTFPEYKEWFNNI